MAKSIKLITSIFVTVLVLCPFYTSAFCPKGTYVFKPRWGGLVCEDCPRGTYMPYDNHTHTECLKCTQIVDSTTEIQTEGCNRIHDSVIQCIEGYYRQPPLNYWQTRETCEKCTKIVDVDLEILIKECDKTHDTVIHCVEGFYRRRPRNDREKERCEKCTECSDSGGYMVTPCQTYTDTHCCQEPNFIAYPDQNGFPICWETPWLCRQGQYFNTDYYRCESCPDGTFMNSDYHIMTKCLPCPTITKPYHLPRYGVVVSPCNKTHPPVLECQEGFYIKYGLGFNKKYIGCSQCKICNENDGQYEGRGCDRFHDTVCCPQPNMTVSNTMDGPSCGIDSTVSPHTETHGDSMPTLDSNNTREFSNHQEKQENEKNEDKEASEEKDVDADSEGRDLSPGETAAIILSVFFIIFIVIIVFVVIRYRPWPFKMRNCYEYDAEDIREMNERFPLLEDASGPQPGTSRYDIILDNIQGKSKNPGPKTYLPFFKVGGPDPCTFKGCVAVMKDGDLSFCIDGDRFYDGSVLPFWQVSVVNEAGERIQPHENVTLSEEGNDLNDNKTVIIKNDYLRDENMKLPDQIRVKWNVKLEEAGHGGSQKLLIECKVSFM